MSIMRQSSKAQDRTLGVWFQHIQQGMVKLPRFQRFEAWDRWRITSFLNTIVNNLPVGVTLALEVAGREKFESRYIAAAEPQHPGPVTQHLLDGQQRLTAFWRAMHNSYEWETFFVHLPKFDRQGDELGEEIEIRCIPRWRNKNGLRMPRWAEEPMKCLERGMIPVSLLRPGDVGQEVDAWLTSATNHLRPDRHDPDVLDKLDNYHALRDQLKSDLTELRERVTHFNLPYLSLPADTEKDVALQVFINMNTNSKPLSLYDIIVAEVESVTEHSLHELEASLREACPNAKRYGDLRNMILATSALLQEKLPNTRGMFEMDKRLLLENWPKLERGLERMAMLLASQGVFDAARLPTNVVLAVVAACYEFIPNHGDFLAKAEKLLRSYVWSAFFTHRYENKADSRAFADFKALKTLLLRQKFGTDELTMVPVLNRDEYPLPNVDELMAAGWPKAAGIEARAIMAVTTYLGAVDFADSRRASFESLQKREYHHVFPQALLKEGEIEGNRALNCALITWKTNRMIGRKDPLDYLRERVEWCDEPTVAQRLRSHLVSYERLSRAHYAGLEGQALKDRLQQDFQDFLRDRAALVVAAMRLLTTGADVSLEYLWSQHLLVVDQGQPEATA